VQIDVSGSREEEEPSTLRQIEVITAKGIIQADNTT
jgi:hypothetical protein